MGQVTQSTRYHHSQTWWKTNLALHHVTAKPLFSHLYTKQPSFTRIRLNRCPSDYPQPYCFSSSRTIARTRTRRVNAGATRRSYFVQLSCIFSAKTIAHNVLTRRSVKRSDLKGLYANDKCNFPIEVSLLLVLALLNATESAILYSTGQIIDKHTKTAHNIIIRDEALEVVQPLRLGRDVAYFTPRNYNGLPKLDSEDKLMSYSEIELEEKRDDIEEQRYEAEVIINHRTKNKIEVEIIIK